MTDRVTASLYGFVNPTGQDAGFVIPLFYDPAGGNSLLAQRVGKGDRIRDFRSVQALGSAVALKEERTRSPGQAALWAFQFGDGTYAVDTRAALSKILMETRGHYRDQPFLFLQIVQFCELASETTSALKAAYAYLASHSRQSAEAWRDIVFLPTLGRSTLDSILVPRPKANLLDDVKFNIRGDSMTVMLPDRLYDQLHRQAKLSSFFRKTVMEKARALDINWVKLGRVERAAVGLKPRNPDTANRTVVIPIGTAGVRLIQKIGKLPPRSGHFGRNAIIEPIQFGPASPKLRGVRIGRLYPTYQLQLPTKPQPNLTEVVGGDTLAILVFPTSELGNENSVSAARAVAAAYRQAGARVIALQSFPEARFRPGSEENYSRAISRLRRYLDYWVFVRPNRAAAIVSGASGNEVNDAIFATVDLIHSCNASNMKMELWGSEKRESMKYAASAYLKTPLVEDIGTTCRKLVEQMMGPISVERANTMVALIERPRRTDNRYQDSFVNLPASFARDLRFSLMDRPVPRAPKSNRALAPSTALLIGVEYGAAPTKFGATCAEILAKNGFKAPSSKGGTDIDATFDGQHFQIECLWSDQPPTRFDRDRGWAGLSQKAIICNWPVAPELALRYALDDVWCVSSVNIPELKFAARENGSFLLNLFSRMPLKVFRETLEAHVGGFLTRELFNNSERYSLFQDLADLSQNTQIESTSDEKIRSVKVQAGEVIIEGTMTIEVELNYGKEEDDHSSDSYPGKFFLKLNREGLRIEDAEVDTSSFYQ